MTPFPPYGLPLWVFLANVELRPKRYLLTFGWWWFIRHALECRDVLFGWICIMETVPFPLVNTWLRSCVCSSIPANETWMVVRWGWDYFQERLLSSLKNRGPDVPELLSLWLLLMWNCCFTVIIVVLWCEASCQVFCFFFFNLRHRKQSDAFCQDHIK